MRTSETIKRVRLGEVCDVLDSMRKPITKQDRVAGPVPYYGATCVQDHVRDYIFDEPLVLLGEDGARWGADERSAYMISGKAWVNNHAHVLRPGAELDRAWLTYYLCHTDLNCYVTGTTVRKLTQDKMRNIELPLPPLPAQRRIAAALDKISEMKRNAEARLQKLDLLVKARFNEMFERGVASMPPLRCDISSHDKYPVVAVGEVFQVGGPKRIHQSEWQDHGVPFLRISDLSERLDGNKRSAEHFISRDRYDQLKAQGQTPVAGDVLVTARGTLGRCYVVEENDEFYFQDGMITWLSHRSEKLDLAYFLNAMKSESFKRQYEGKMPGSTVAYLSIAQLAKLKLPLPPLSLQREFAAFVEKVEALKATAQASLARVELLYRAKLQEYFG